jgi:ubiquinone/menaquinone biosynthesis C-methylase UbiE
MKEITAVGFFETDNKSAYEAQQTAYWISFAPIVFQVSRTLVNTGILKKISDARKEGITIDELEEQTTLGRYQLRVLVHASLGIGLTYTQDGRYFLTKTGFFLLNDTPVRVNMDFIHDVCYQGLFHLEDSIKTGKPEGLKVFGEWDTIYEGLSQLPKQAQQSWFGLDHYYSDEAFPKVIPLLLADNPAIRVLDIGGNTGKFARKLISASREVQITIVDLPGQIAMAAAQLKPSDPYGQVTFHSADMLKEETILPGGYDIIWMSQFLDCFSEAQIVSILKRCREAAGDHGKICILEGFWDKQKIETSAFCLQQFSLYFTAMANGNSQMYDYQTFSECIDAAGLYIEEEYHNLSISNSLLVCRSKQL